MSADGTAAMTAAPAFSFTLSAHRTATGGDWSELARRAEDLGYTTLAIPDHRSNQFSPIPALAAAAAVTSTLRLATQVLCNGLRHPLLLAEELATVDVLSSGRLEWGIGAGWLPDDFLPLDATFDDAGLRIDRLIEAVTLMRKCFGGGPVAFDGNHFRAHRTQPALAAIQQPHPPLLIGGSQQRILQFGAQIADIVHLSPHPQSRRFGNTPASVGVTESMDRQVAWIHDAARGREVAPTLAATALPALVTDDIAEVAARLATPTGLTPDEVRVSPHVLIGSIGEICDTLEYRRDRWSLSTWSIPQGALAAFAPVISRLTT